MSKRNVLVILCDQLRPDFISIYGGKAVPTPNLERLAADGCVFDCAITQSTVCAPARATMMTGRYVSDHGVWTNDVPFRDGVEYIAERMAEHGYRCACFGKMHHNPPHDMKGFNNESIPMEEGRLGESEPYRNWLRARHPEMGSWTAAKNFTFPYPEAEYYEHFNTSNTLDFIDRCDNDPFFAWLSFQGPHGPFDPPAEVKGTIDENQLPRRIDLPEIKAPTAISRLRQARLCIDDDVNFRQRVAYAEMIVEIDRQIGRVLDHLHETGKYTNTTIIFSADHGDMLHDYCHGPKGPYPYRAQLRIPLLLANHPQIEPGNRTRNLAGNIDIPGTVLDIAGDERGIGHSFSLIDLARHAPRNPREIVFSEFCDSIKTVYDGQYVFCYYPFTGETELYNHENDPAEIHNLGSKPEFAELEQRMLMHIIDFQTIAKGVRVEAHDFATEQQNGLRRKSPRYQRDFPVAFPLTKPDIERLNRCAMDSTFNEFCRDKTVICCYGKPYWAEQSDENQ